MIENMADRRHRLKVNCHTKGFVVNVRGVPLRSHHPPTPVVLQRQWWEGGYVGGAQPPAVQYQVVSVANDPNFLAMGQELLRLDATQRNLEATLTQKIEKTHQEAQKKSDEIAANLSKLIGDSMNHMQGKMMDMVQVLAMAPPPQEGGGHQAPEAPKWPFYSQLKMWTKN
jgi:hypothetical protein